MTEPRSSSFAARRLESLPTKISITRSIGGHIGERINIRLVDESSHVQILETWLSPVDFASALFGSAETPCTTDLIQSPKVGTIAENKTEFVPNPEKYGEEGMVAIREAAKVHEVDGWRADSYSLKTFNGHCRTNEGYRIIYRRYLDPETREPVNA